MKWFKKHIWTFLVFIIVTIAGIWVTDGYNWLMSQFSRSSPLKIDFQVAQGCLNGELVNIKRHFANQSIRLERGADRLIICDPDVLHTNVDNAPRDIANAFPGCLRFADGSLIMLRASDSVCAFPSQSVFICDGESAAMFPGSAALGVQSQTVPECPKEILFRFGFDATNGA